ncbi:hypothetical protein KEM60_02167 [Austwickia sp. TVS 96-490-7B]|nr:hypothetical protein [Austwickia sp. TVS 96-490-7B]
MAVTFGTRSAMRDLAEEVGETEIVDELAACTYAGAAGLVALTDQRVIAIRDDYSKHQVQSVQLADVVTVDYNPTVHDGFALFTTSGRLVVRKMRRDDGDRLVDALLTQAPHISISVTRPSGAPGAAPQSLRPQLGRHRKPAAVSPAAAANDPSRMARPPAGATPDPLVAPRISPTVAAQANAAHVASQAVLHQPGVAQQPAQPTYPGQQPLPGAVDPHQFNTAAAFPGAASLPAVGSPPGTPYGGAPAGAPGIGPVGSAPPAAPAMPPGPAVTPTTPAPTPASPASAGQPPGARPATDKEILLGVLADLHAQGVLTAEEFAAKVRLIVSQP